MTMTQQPQYARYLLYSSRLTIISILTAYYYQLWDCCLLTLIITTTSQLYWSYPIDGWRRHLDMLAVLSGLSYQVAYTAWRVPWWTRLTYYLFVSLMGGSYLVARYYGRHLEYRLACGYHLLLHCLGNLSNIWLYTHHTNEIGVSK